MARRVGEETAALLRRRFKWLGSFSDDELRQISFCAEGETLSRDEQYFDLSHPERGVIGGDEQQTVPEGSCYVARSRLPATTWRKLTSFFGGGTRLGTSDQPR